MLRPSPSYLIHLLEEQIRQRLWIQMLYPHWGIGALRIVSTILEQLLHRHTITKKILWIWPESTWHFNFKAMHVSHQRQLIEHSLWVTSPSDTHTRHIIETALKSACFDVIVYGKSQATWGTMIGRRWHYLKHQYSTALWEIALSPEALTPTTLSQCRILWHPHLLQVSKIKNHHPFTLKWRHPYALFLRQLSTKHPFLPMRRFLSHHPQPLLSPPTHDFGRYSKSS